MREKEKRASMIFKVNNNKLLINNQLSFKNTSSHNNNR